MRRITAADERNVRSLSTDGRTHSTQDHPAHGREIGFNVVQPPVIDEHDGV